MFALKKHGTLQFCVAYCQPIAVTVWDTYLLQNMDKCIDSLWDAQCFQRKKVLADIKK